MCVYTGLRSPFWLNPDEYDVKAAVTYYFTHFMPPDIRSDIITDSFPVYGTSRHFEWNLFYFYAGKLGQFFQDAPVQSDSFFCHGRDCAEKYPEALRSFAGASSDPSGMVYFQLFHFGCIGLFCGVFKPLRAFGGE